MPLDQAQIPLAFKIIIFLCQTDLMNLVTVTHDNCPWFTISNTFDTITADADCSVQNVMNGRARIYSSKLSEQV